MSLIFPCTTINDIKIERIYQKRNSYLVSILTRFSSHNIRQISNFLLFGRFCLLDTFPIPILKFIVNAHLLTSCLMILLEVTIGQQYTWYRLTLRKLTTKFSRFTFSWIIIHIPIINLSGQYQNFANRMFLNKIQAYFNVTKKNANLFTF